MNLNRATTGSTYLHLPHPRGTASIRLGLYSGLWPGTSFWPLLAGLVNPPQRLVDLWWRELGELARMIGREDACVGRDFEHAFARRMTDRAVRPWWHSYDADDIGDLTRFCGELARRNAGRASHSRRSPG